MSDTDSLAAKLGNTTVSDVPTVNFDRIHNLLFRKKEHTRGLTMVSANEEVPEDEVKMNGGDNGTDTSIDSEFAFTDDRACRGGRKGRSAYRVDPSSRSQIDWRTG